MSVSPTVQLLPAAEPSDAQGGARAAQIPALPGSGRGSTGETQATESRPAVAAIQQDEVKVQIEPPGEIAVYQFVNQQGTLVLQVPPQQVLNLARAISQEFAQEAVHESAAIKGGNDHGH
jgi:hypothetical protein